MFRGLSGLFATFSLVEKVRVIPVSPFPSAQIFKQNIPAQTTYKNLNYSNYTYINIDIYPYHGTDYFSLFLFLFALLLRSFANAFSERKRRESCES